MQTANITHHLTLAERQAAAMAIWNHEKGTAATVILISWLFKVMPTSTSFVNVSHTLSVQFYFALLIYSYATHLRKGSYRALPLSRSFNYGPLYEPALDLADEEFDADIYPVPLRNLPTATSSSGRSPRRTASASSNSTAMQHKSNGSLSSFADFVSAPGRHPRRSKNMGGSVVARDRGLDIEEVIFDEDELTYVSGSSSRTHSKLDTEGSSTAASTDDERGKHGPD